MTPLPQPPPVPDYNRIAEESEARSNAKIRATEERVERSRSGRMEPSSGAAPKSGPDGFVVELDWRGESAYYIEADRRVWVFASYWGGPIGHLSDIHAAWEYTDGRRAPLSAGERIDVLRRLVDYIKLHEGFRMRAEELETEPPAEF